MNVSLTRTVLIDKSPYLVYAVPVIQTPYTIDSELEALLVAEIEPLKKYRRLLRRFFWFAGLQSSGRAGIIIIKSGHDKHSTEGASRSAVSLVVVIERAVIF